MKLNTLLILVAVLMSPILGWGQTEPPIRAERIDIHTEDEKRTVDIDIILQDLHIPAAEYIMVTPVITDRGLHSESLPPIVVNGATSQRRYNRSLLLNGPVASEYRVMKSSGIGKPQEIIPYRATVTDQAWMNQAELILVVENCDCGRPRESYEVFVCDLAPHTLPEFAVTFLTPPAESVKKRELSGEASILFRVNQTTLMEELGSNRAELQKVRNSIDYIDEEEDFQIESIHIEAYASPEGNYENNIRLAQGRAHALKNYILTLYNIESSLISLQSKGENWEGLQRALLQSPVFTPAQKEEIQKILALQPVELRKSRLKSYEGGKPYQYLLQEVYPSLRKSVYKIQYIAPEFSVERGRELIKTKPGTLSLEEIYKVADSYEPNSEEFKKVFDIAVRLYPENRIANLNAAAIELEKNQPALSRQYLQPYLHDPQAFNNVGILYAQEGQMYDAQLYFELAADQGDPHAKENLSKLIEYRKRTHQ